MKIKEKKTKIYNVVIVCSSLQKKLVPFLTPLIRVWHINYCTIYLKLVLLEWPESKSNGRFGFSMLKNPPVQIFGAIGATSGVWQHIAIFAWWHVQVIFNSSSIKLYIKILNFIFFHCHIILKKFLSNIISHTLKLYPNIDFLILVPEIAA